MNDQTIHQNPDRYILPSAFSYAALLNALLWSREGIDSFDFLLSGEVFLFGFLTAACAAMMIGAFYSLNRFRLEPILQYSLGLFIGGIPIMALIIWTFS
ncbi:hypothetical protein [Flavilitoribacter nigricans]|uniref:Uncharacterized protein n=1 Tax=Flavilitoribacter nigricans (strain ATCC 23147 / DSM 23189 / NBRC 102662 / NCIMB 1420 / SS-2) TaxID=1122177 RepID=A0A2D0NAB7_FLAN2|nr:hypothetical protein [Flavilitoribacter nigricans]PHN05326.1 hypothetical protein CRP01_17575 [Flavilitoribacter nigricans DSM 23189 = NBRC 102662]